MPKNRFFVCFCCVLMMPGMVFSQRSYQPNSVLATGNWYKIAVKEAGVYKIDIPLLNSLGLNTANFPSNSLRLFGNGGNMLAESNAGPWIDDLQENALFISDGGDGILNGADYALFYASGPDQWTSDPANASFNHQKNLYSDRSYYFLSIGGNGKRIGLAPPVPAPNIVVNSFSARFFHELDSVNFLGSGKEWYGEEFANMPGRNVSRDFVIEKTGFLDNSPVRLVSQCAARSLGSGSRFDIRINNQPAGQLLINAVGGGLYDFFAQQATSNFSVNVSQPALTINYTYVPSSFNAQAWLNWFEVFGRGNLSLNGVDQLLFRDWQSIGGGNVAEFVISQANTSTRVWDVTDPINPIEMPGNFAGNEFRFTNTASQLREYVAFNASRFMQPTAIGKINNQDLHASSPRDLLIVTHPAFQQDAERLAQFHQQRNNLRTLVVTTAAIYNEFASGSPDPVAIRDYVKMYYDKYKNNPADKPRWLLLFGDGSYDYKDRLNNNSNFVPAWENNVSLDPLSTYTSDDFYGFLDDNEDINSALMVNLLDLGIGRVPARTPDESKNFVDKLTAYFSRESFGPWRNNLTFIADDEDYNLHFQDAEILTTTANTILPFYNLQKIYLDAFRQESGSGGSTYPQVELAINNQVYNGTLIWNYSGHGGARRLAEETILDQEIVNSWNNPNRLPLFITATCDFAPYDNPAIHSIGEDILLRPKTGGIALMTTTRVVFAFSNRIMNNNYLQFALLPDANGQYRSLGDAVKDAKNHTYQTSGDLTNNRKFTLLGDPAMVLAFPVLKTRITKINGIPASQVDTLSAAEKAIVEGEVTDVQGNLLSGFNGTVYPIVFDKAQTIQTLANDPQSLPAAFQTQTNALFKGKVSVTNGRFTFEFKVPKDINYQFGNGKLSLYAENGTEDASDAFTGFLIGGAGNNNDNDDTGPEIKSYLNDEKFVNGGITNETPVLIVKLSDSSGINTVGTGIGHDIVATLDDDNNKFFLLNDFYQGELDSYQQGVARFQLPAMEPGPHSLKIKAWDVLNNSSEITLEFNVVKDGELTLSRVLNYPNPFTTKTQFWFEHNKPGQNLQVRLQIFTVSGRIIKMIQQTINTAGNRSIELEWNGRDEYGEKVGRGTYLYKLSVTAPGGFSREKIERLVIF